MRRSISSAGRIRALTRRLWFLKVGLDDDGNCVLFDEEQNALMPWQVRRRALEETFFMCRNDR